MSAARGIVPVAMHLTYDAAESYRVGCPVWSFTPNAERRAKPCRDCRGGFLRLKDGRCVYCRHIHKHQAKKGG